MIKPLEILEIKPFELLIKFSNNEIKVLDVEHTIDRNIKNVEIEKLFDKDFFKTVKIGELGQLYWENIAQMNTEKGPH